MPLDAVTERKFQTQDEHGRQTYTCVFTCGKWKFIARLRWTDDEGGGLILIEERLFDKPEEKYIEAYMRTLLYN